MRDPLYFYFIKNTFWINLMLSGLFAVLGTAWSADFGTSFLAAFSLLFPTLGYAITLLALHSFNRKTKYMYYNRGISLFRLYLAGFLFNLLFVAALNIIVALIWRM